MNLIVTTVSDGAELELTTAEISDDVALHCRAMIDVENVSNPDGTANPCDTPESYGDACQEAICLSQVELCRALVFREIGEGADTVELVDVARDPVYRIEPQDAESSVAADQAAQTAAARALDWARDGLLTSCGENDHDGTAPPSPFHALSSAESLDNPMELLASTLVEALRVGEAAADAGARAALGVADRDRVAIPDLGRAARLSWFDDNLSRLVAVQSQVGGVGVGPGGLASPSWVFHAGAYADDPTLPYVVGAHADPTSLPELGVGSREPCRGGCASALGMLRSSGVQFADIISSDATVSLDALSASAISSWESRTGADLFQGTASAESLAAGLDVSTRSVREAREWMRYESIVFARPVGIVGDAVGAPPLADGTPQTVSGLDATTRAEPTPPPAMHYLTAAQATHLWSTKQGWPATTAESPRLPVLRPERAYLFAYAHAVAAEALARDANDLGCAGADTCEVRNVLGTVVMDARARRAVETEICVDALGQDMRVRLFGVQAEPTPGGGEYVIVEGSNELRCAVTGVLEGQPCTLTAPAAPVTGWTTVSGPGPRTSRRRAVQFDIQAPSGSGAHLYVLRSRDGATGPGAYEAIAGISGEDTTVTKGHCTTIPYDHQSHDLGARVVAIDDEMDPAHACSDLPDRLPLEDEIIDDGDPYEDSWQHHLRVAANTAAHADDLGQRLIQSGLQMDENAERSVDQIQELCGTHVNLDELFGSDGTLQNLIDTDDGCSEPSDMSCAEGYECLGTQCVLSSLLGSEDSSQREALEECLGVGESGAVVEAVALGNRGLCAWRPIDRPKQLCAGSNAPCPTVQQPGTACTLPDDPALSSGYEVVQISNDPAGMEPDIGEVLGIVGSVSPDGDPPPGATIPGARPTDRMCDAIAEFRTSSDLVLVGSPLWEQLRGTDRPDEDGRHGPEVTFWSYENIRQWAGRIGWVGEPGNFSRLTLDGAPLRDDAGAVIGTTGSVGTGVASGAWPCNGSASVSAQESSPLFPLSTSPTSGTSTDCSFEYERANMNWRLARAAATLNALSGVGLDNLRLPVYYDGYTEGDLAEADDIVPAGDYHYASSLPVDDTTNGLVWGPVGLAEGVLVWTAPTGFSFEARTEGSGDCPRFGSVACVNTVRPLSFLNFGTRFSDDDEQRAEFIARSLWAGVGDGPSSDSSRRDTGFFGNIALPPLGGGYGSDGERRARERRLFYRALRRGRDAWDTVYVRNGRGSEGGSSVEQLTHLFNAPVYDHVWTSGTNRNLAHVFGDSFDGSTVPDGYGLYFTRRDLLDAMELVCRVASFTPPPAGMTADAVDSAPVVTSADDIPSVRRYVDRVASGFDALAQAQVVQDVPQDVVDAIRVDNVTDATSSSSRRPDAVTGDYGALTSQLTQQLRTMGEAPRDIAASLRGLSTELDVMRRNQDIFDRQQQLLWLQYAVDVVRSIIGCVSAISSAQMFKEGTAGGLCAGYAAIAVLQGVMTSLRAENLEDEQQNAFDQFVLRVEGHLDMIEGRRVDFLNAIDQARVTLGELRQARLNAQSALAQAAFASSNAAGRQYQTNTVMRRSYDINLQRYRAAHRAAVRNAAIARRAVEQRFGVNLEEQTCAQLVDPPATWAADVCNATGVNYAELRDADAEFGEDTIRQMFIGDYVRRLEQYVESYRFDYPYSSGDDLMVLSLRDDVVRARSTCTAEAPNLLGASNDLEARQMPLEDGLGGSSPAWAVRDCANVAGSPAVNCLAVTPLDGPRWSVAGDPMAPEPRVVGRIDREPPRGFEVRFAPRDSMGSYSGDYANGASYSQEVYLAPGTYRLSWYENASGTYHPAVDVRQAGASLGGTVYGVDHGSDASGTARSLADGWVRRYRFVQINSAEADSAVDVGVFAATVPSDEEQWVTVAGLQLEDVTGTGVDTSMASLAAQPGPFVATTAPGWALFDDCDVGEPQAFRDAWTYTCTQLCSGGFSERCLDGEEPEEFCFWELGFSIDEDRLLGRGGRFGGGFAFGNFNYRTGEVAVNVVGTGVRDCDYGDACYSTAGIPFSFVHRPPASGEFPGQYTVRAHDGGLHPVDLFEGRIESARALAAERYLTNPLSSADTSLLSDYFRGELRGRPMTGNYRIIVWDNGEVAFRNIEDVQILWRYRYFTRTGESLTCGD